MLGVAGAASRQAPGAAAKPPVPPPPQVLSLGAGLDSLYFCLKSRGLLAHATLFEVDFPAVSSQKAALIAGAEQLAALAGPRLSPLEAGVELPPLELPPTPSVWGWERAETLLCTLECPEQTGSLAVRRARNVSRSASVFVVRRGLRAPPSGSPDGPLASFPGAVTFAAEDYRLLGVDLSDLPLLEKALRGAGLDPEAPSLLLAEVVLTYMDEERLVRFCRGAASPTLGCYREVRFVFQVGCPDSLGRPALCAGLVCAV